MKISVKELCNSRAEKHKNYLKASLPPTHLHVIVFRIKRIIAQLLENA